MTVHADAILAEARFSADLQNGLVVNKALQVTSKQRQCGCHYRTHMAVFRCYHQRYMETRTRISQEKRKINRTWDDGDVIGNTNHLLGLQCYAERLRDRLSEIWPCKACMLRFNPTGKRQFFGQQLESQISILVDDEEPAVLEISPWASNGRESCL